MFKDWNGSNGGFRNGNNWSPAGKPAAGDDLTIASGMPHLRHGSFGENGNPTDIHLIGTPDQPAGLVLANVTLNDVMVDESTGVVGDYSTRAGTLVIKGEVVNDGGEIEAAGAFPTPDSLELDMRPGSALINDGTLRALPSAKLDVNGCATNCLENDGNVIANGGTVTISAQVTGTGNMFAEENEMLSGNIELKGAVDAGQTLHLDRGGFQIDAPRQFLGALDVPAVSGSVLLEGLNAASWATNGSLLELFDSSGALADTVRLTPQATPVNLQVASFTDPSYGQGVRISAVPIGFPPGSGLLPQHDFAPVS